MSCCKPAPIPLRRELDRAAVETHVARACPRLTDCEALAARENWRGMSCAACHGRSGLALEGAPGRGLCPHCGLRVTPVGVCVYCGAEITAGAGGRLEFRGLKRREVEAAAWAGPAAVAP